MPARAPDPSRRSTTGRPGVDDEPPRADPGGAAAPDVDAATLRLRELLQPADPWRERLDVGRVTEALRAMGPGRAVAVVVGAIVLGVVAFAVAAPGRTSSIDPVQVLPRVDAASTRAPAAGAGGAEPDPGAALLPAVGAEAPAGPPGSAPPRIQVHAAGAVAFPGVHELPDGARVADLIAAAGGLAVDADPDRINLAAPVRDGERVYVPRSGEAAAPDVVAGSDPGTAGGTGPLAPDGRGGAERSPAALVDINRADAAALDALPGIGPTTAEAIIRYRSENGSFRSVDDLQEVPGIGPAKLAQLRDRVRVG